MTDISHSAQSRQPSLDSIETTGRHRLPTCYHEHRFSKFEPEYKAALDMYAAIDDREGKHRVRQLEDCRKFAWFARHEQSGHVKVISNACRLRWCPVCAEAKRVSIQHSVSKWLKTLRRPRFLTLTLQHSTAPLAEQIKALYRGFRLFRKHKSIKSKVRGGVWFFQVKISGKDACWHPHLHIVLDANYINKFELSQEWFLATGNSFIIDIRAIKDPEKVGKYVSRYCAQPAHLPDFAQDDRIEIASVLHGVRFCGRFGTGAQCDLKAGTPEDRTLWKRLGTWYDIIVNRCNDPVFHEIKIAWLFKKNIERSLCECLIRQGEPDTLPKLSIGVAKSSDQLCFEQFVRR